eukprot:216332-Prymnesium_polylepis.1
MGQEQLTPATFQLSDALARLAPPQRPYTGHAPSPSSARRLQRRVLIVKLIALTAGMPCGDYAPHLALPRAEPHQNSDVLAIRVL